MTSVSRERRARARSAATAAALARRAGRRVAAGRPAARVLGRLGRLPVATGLVTDELVGREGGLRRALAVFVHELLVERRGQAGALHLGVALVPQRLLVLLVADPDHARHAVVLLPGAGCGVAGVERMGVLRRLADLGLVTELPGTGLAGVLAVLGEPG